MKAYSRRLQTYQPSWDQSLQLSAASRPNCACKIDINLLYHLGKFVEISFCSTFVICDIYNCSFFSLKWENLIYLLGKPRHQNHAYFRRHFYAPKLISNYVYLNFNCLVYWIQIRQTYRSNLENIWHK